MDTQTPDTITAQVDRARQFLRDIRDAVCSHPVAARTCEFRLHERRDVASSVLRMSGTVDGLPVELHVHVHDHEPQRPRLEYSQTLERLRTGQVLSLSASAFTAAHDQACYTHYADGEPWQQTVRIAQRQSRLLASFTRGGLH